MHIATVSVCLGRMRQRLSGNDVPGTRQRLLPFKSGWCCEPNPIKVHPAIQALNELPHEYQTRQGSCHSRAGGAASQTQTKVNLPFTRKLPMPPGNR